MNKIEINTQYITLQQFLKYVGIADTGSHAKFLIEEYDILVNGQIVKQRGKKLYSGDRIEFDSQTYEIV